MGFFSDLFGGVDFAPPPPQLGQLATQAEDLAGNVTELYNTGINSLGQLPSRIRNAYTDAYQEGFGARDFAVQNQPHLLQNYQLSQRLIPQTLKEIGMAGSADRQRRAAQLAESDFDRSYQSAMGQQDRQLGRMGVRAGSGMYSQPSFLEQSLGRASAGNQARFRERSYGEGVRRQMLPNMQGAYGNTIQGLFGASDAYAQQANYLKQAAGSHASAYAPYLPIAQLGQQMTGNAHQLHTGTWDSGNQYSAAQAGANNNMYNNVLDFGAKAIPFFF